jgi:hypothetical protein
MGSAAASLTRLYTGAAGEPRLHQILSLVQVDRRVVVLDPVALILKPLAAWFLLPAPSWSCLNSV